MMTKKRLEDVEGVPVKIGGMDYTRIDIYPLGKNMDSKETILMPVGDGEPMFPVGSGWLDCFPPNIIHTLPRQYADDPLEGICASFDKFCEFSKYHIGVRHMIEHKYAGEDDASSPRLGTNESMRRYCADVLAWVEDDNREFITKEEHNEEMEKIRKDRLEKRKKAKDVNGFLKKNEIY